MRVLGHGALLPCCMAALAPLSIVVIWLKEKKHATDLAPYQPELIPFQPVDGADTRYGQMCKPIGECPFKEAGITGFIPPTPFKVSANFIDIGDFKDFCWSALLKLIDELDLFLWRDEDERRLVMSDEDTPFSVPAMYCLVVLCVHWTSNRSNQLTINRID
jgi:hypothetical protein